MAITRVVLRASRLGRGRDSRSLRVSSRPAKTSSSDSDTVQGLNDTKALPSSDELSSDRLRREVNLTKALQIEAERAQQVDAKIATIADNAVVTKALTGRGTADGASTPHNQSATIGAADCFAAPNATKLVVENTDSIGRSAPIDPHSSAAPFDASVPGSGPSRSVDSANAGPGHDVGARKLDTAPADVNSESATAEANFEPSQASESRLDLISGEWTIYATTRSQRPDQFAGAVLKPATVVNCPFCAGQESRTPSPVWSSKLDDDDHNGSEWSVRVVPNLYPAVSDEGAPRAKVDAERLPEEEVLPHSARRHRSLTAGKFNAEFLGETATSIQPPSPADRKSEPRVKLFPSLPATGGHEVFIESPRHTESFSELNTAEMALVFAAYAHRIEHWRSVAGIEHVSIFKNVGRDAGASLQHSHSQLIATNRVPTVVQQVTRRLQAHYARTGSCLQCDLVRGEIQERSRLVSQTDSFVAYCPYASRFPLQVRITSKEHLACFSDLRLPRLSEVSRLVLRVVRWLEALRPGTAYNVLLHTCPVNFPGARESQHWALDIFPRMSRLAGFELATGAMINPIFPENAAKAYREQARQSDPRYVLR